MPARPISREDLNHVLNHAHDAFAALAHANIFITGGTGFFGHSLLESLLHANRVLKLDLRVTVLTRNATRFSASSPHITNDPAITLLEGDIRTFVFPSTPHTHILHAATDSGGQQTHQSPEDLAASILTGTQRVLDFAHHAHATRLLYTSTGAVYGRSTTLLHTPESFLDTTPPHLPANSYEDAKRRAELLCLAHPNLQPVIARCFAFIGPHLPLDQHFAIGNFIASALANEPIHIKGDGTPRRSWLYTADLAIWLWTMLAQGTPSRAYNVGSDQGHTIAEAARITADTLAIPDLSLRPALPTLSSRPKRSEVERPAVQTASDLHHLPIHIDGKSKPPANLFARINTPNPSAPLNSYVPDISRATAELNLRVTIPLEEALRRTAAWHVDK